MVPFCSLKLLPARNCTLEAEILLVRYEEITQYFSGISVHRVTVNIFLITGLNIFEKIRFFRVEMWFNAVYCLFVFINVFNVFGLENLQTVPFYFILVIPKATISFLLLASSEVKLDLILQISHKVRHPVEDIFSCILRYTFLSRNLYCCYIKNQIKSIQANKHQIYAPHLINVVVFFKPSKQCIRPQFL